MWLAVVAQLIYKQLAAGQLNVTDAGGEMQKKGSD